MEKASACRVSSIEHQLTVPAQTEVVEVKTQKGSEAYHEAMTMEPLQRFHPRTIGLASCLLLGFFCQTVNGFDGSLFGGLTGESRVRQCYFSQKH